MTSRHAALLLLGLASVPPPGLAAQWSITIEAAASYYGGTSRDTAADPTAFRPHHPSIVGVRVDRRWGQVGLGVGAALARSDLVAENSVAGAILKDALDLVEIAPEAAVAVSQASWPVGVRLHAGPVIDVWSPSGGGGRTRTRVGGHAGVSLEWPLAARWAGSVRVAAALSGSLFEAGELPGGYERRAMWRTSVGLGLRYRP